MATPSNSLALRLAVEPAGKNLYSSRHLPLRMGNSAPISYGGFQLGVAINAACQTANSNHYLYSLTGYYLGPVSTESTISCAVEEIRNTRTFSTREVRVTQGARLCLIVLADFRTAEVSLLTYTCKPLRQYTSWESCKTDMEIKEDLLKRNIITKKQAEIHEFFFKEGTSYFESRFTPEGIVGQNLTGIAKSVQTTQDSLPLSEKTSAEWYRMRHKLQDNNENMAALGFLIDGALSFLPLTHSHMFLDDAGACSSLEFALRIFSNSINLNEWHLSEKRTICGDLGLTHGVTNMFDTRGQLVAQMSQQSILRPKPAKGEKSKI